MEMKKKRTKIKGGFILLPHYKTNSEPWRKCCTDANWVYCELLKKKKTGKADDDEKLPINQREELRLTYSEVEYKMHSRRFTKAMKALVENGFIEVKEQGGLYRRKSIYVFSPGWKEKDPKMAKELREKREYARQFENWGGALEKTPPPG